MSPMRGSPGVGVGSLQGRRNNRAGSIALRARVRQGGERLFLGSGSSAGGTNHRGVGGVGLFLSFLYKYLKYIYTHCRYHWGPLTHPHTHPVTYASHLCSVYKWPPSHPVTVSHAVRARYTSARHGGAAELADPADPVPGREAVEQYIRAAACCAGPRRQSHPDRPPTDPLPTPADPNRPCC
jgi:hypothetical protein